MNMLAIPLDSAGPVDSRSRCTTRRRCPVPQPRSPPRLRDTIGRPLPTPTEPTRAFMWALAHPLRFQIWEILREGPSTAARLARRLEESRGSTSYHLRYL